MEDPQAYWRKRGGCARAWLDLRMRDAGINREAYKSGRQHRNKHRGGSVRYTNIIHLSDLHLKTDATGRFNQSLVLDALTDDLRMIRDTQLRPDCLVFSGDLAQDADDPEIYDELYVVIEELASSAGLPVDKVFLCPGNHDISRAAVGPALPSIRSLRNVRTIDDINRLATNTAFVSHIGKAFSAFAGFSKRFGRSYLTYEDAVVTQYYLRDLQTSFICANTATLSGAGLADEYADDRALLLPEISLDAALRRVPKGAQAIVVGHHPLTSLSEQNEALIRNLLCERAAIYMSGHLHAAVPMNVRTPIGECTFAQAGSLYASREWWNGYAILSTVPGEIHHRLTYRRWHEQRRKFGVASELDDDGVVYSSKDAKAFWSSVTPKLDYRLLDKWRLDVFKPYLMDHFGDDFASLCDNSRFVDPEFERDTYVETVQGLEKAARPELLNFNEACRSGDNLVIAAPNELGKTTLIRQFATWLSNIQPGVSGWSISVVLRHSELRNYVKGIEKIS